MAEVSGETGQRRPCWSGSRAALRSPAAGPRATAPPAGPRKAARRRRGMGGAGRRRGAARLPEGRERARERSPFGTRPRRLRPRPGRAAGPGGGGRRRRASGRGSLRAVAGAADAGRRSLGASSRDRGGWRAADPRSAAGMQRGERAAPLPRRSEPTRPSAIRPPAASPDRGLRGQRERSGTLYPEACEVRRPRAQRPTHTSTPSPAERPESLFTPGRTWGGGHRATRAAGHRAPLGRASWGRGRRDGSTGAGQERAVCARAELAGRGPTAPPGEDPAGPRLSGRGSSDLSGWWGGVGRWGREGAPALGWGPVSGSSWPTLGAVDKPWSWGARALQGQAVCVCLRG